MTAQTDMPPPSSDERLKAIKALVEFKTGLDQISALLGAYGHDYQGEEFPLLARHIVKILERYLAQELDSTTVEKWANLVECREDIDFSAPKVGKALHELANPYLTRPLDKKRAEELINHLANQGV